MCTMLCKVLRMRSPLRNSLYPPMVKNLLAVWETWVGPLGWEDPLEEGMAAHSGILAWRIRTDRQPGWLPSMESHLCHDPATKYRAGSENTVNGIQCDKRCVSM